MTGSQRLHRSKPASVNSAPLDEAAIRRPEHPILQLQAVYGNQVVNRLLASEPPVVEPQSSLGQGRSSQSTVADSSPIQAKTAFQGISQALNPPRPAPGTGMPLPAAMQQKMEASFNADFSDVRIHQDEAAEQIGAIAFTRGSNIHFAPGEFNPTSQSGQQLLGHELAHVVQQRHRQVPAAPSQDLPINTNPKLEAEADQIGMQVAQGQVVSPSGGQGAQSQTSSENAIQAKLGWDRQRLKTEAGSKTGRSDLYKRIFRVVAAYEQWSEKESTKVKIGLLKDLINACNDWLTAEKGRTTSKGINRRRAITQLFLDAKSELALLQPAESALSQAAVSSGSDNADQQEEVAAPSLTEFEVKEGFDEGDFGSDLSPVQSTEPREQKLSKLGLVYDPDFGWHLPTSGIFKTSASEADQEKLLLGEISLDDLQMGWSKAPSADPKDLSLPTKEGSLEQMDPLGFLQQQFKNADLAISDDADLAWLSEKDLNRLAKVSKYQFLRLVNREFKGEEKAAKWLNKKTDNQLNQWGIRRDDIPNIKVDYKRGAERNDFELTFKDGKIYQNDAVLDTTSGKTVMGHGAVIFTMNRNGRFYATSQKVGETHHSTFLGAGAAAGAGEMVVEQGALKKINNQSGHYFPPKQQMIQVLSELRDQGISLQGVELKYIPDPEDESDKAFEGYAQKWLVEQGLTKLLKGDIHPQMGEIKELGFVWNGIWKDYSDRPVDEGDLKQIEKILKLGGAKELKRLGAVWSDDDSEWQTPIEHITLDLGDLVKILKKKLSVHEMDEQHRQEAIQREIWTDQLRQFGNGDIDKAMEKLGFEWEEEYGWVHPTSKNQMRLDNLDLLKMSIQLLNKEINMEDIEL